jgi:two-component system, OmpR family, response regulator
MFRILVAESDQELKRTISRALVKSGYDVKTADAGDSALDMTGREYFDAVIAEVMLPGIDGFTLVRSLRAAGMSIPVILISENGGYEYLHQSFVSGADEYLSKPLNMNELCLRVGALLRRTQMISERARTIGSTVVDYDAMTVSYNGKSIMLPLKEFLLLYKLCASPGRIITRQQIMDDIWGYENGADMHTVDVHISRLRSRLRDNGDIRISTVRGIGYKLEKV